MGGSIPNSADIEGTSYPFPTNVNGNSVRFTPVQVKAIQSGLNASWSGIDGGPLPRQLERLCDPFSGENVIGGPPQRHSAASGGGVACEAGTVRVIQGECVPCVSRALSCFGSVFGETEEAGDRVGGAVSDEQEVDG